MEQMQKLFFSFFFRSLQFDKFKKSVEKVLLWLHIFFVCYCCCKITFLLVVFSPKRPNNLAKKKNNSESRVCAFIFELSLIQCDVHTKSLDIYIYVKTNFKIKVEKFYRFYRSNTNS